jgi:hypothetical protein
VSGKEQNSGIKGRPLYDPRTKRVMVNYMFKGGSLVLQQDGELWDPIQDRCVSEEELSQL